MKKIISVLLLFAVCVSVFLCGCKKDDNTVTVSINASTLSQEELSDLEKFARDNGFDSAVYNKKKGIVELKIGTTEHDKLTYSLGVTVIRNVFSMINSEEYPYIKAIKRNNNFSDMTVSVKKSAYEKAENSGGISEYIANCCLVYLNYEDLDIENKKCTVRIVDEKTENVISEKTYSVEDMK